jgi:hypothetical protein
VELKNHQNKFKHSISTFVDFVATLEDSYQESTNLRTKIIEQIRVELNFTAFMMNIQSQLKS